MYSLEVLLSNDEKCKIEIEKPELIYGMTAIMLKDSAENSGYAINPINKEKIRIINGDKNKAIIPLHNEEDYELAIKENIPKKLAVMPYFQGENESKIREDKETINRHSIIAIIKHPFEDKYLCEESTDGKYKSFVQGGIENGEAIEQAAIREVREETGYNEVEILNISDIPVINHFYAAYKGDCGTNRFAKLEIVSGVLKSLNQLEIDENEKKKHNIKWINKEELQNFLNINHNKYAFEYVSNNKKVFEGNGIIYSNDINNNKEFKEVRDYIIKKFNMSEY